MEPENKKHEPQINMAAKLVDHVIEELKHVFFYAVTILIFQIKRIISSEEWFNYFVPFFFFKMQKLGLVRQR